MERDPRTNPITDSLKKHVHALLKASTERKKTVCGDIETGSAPRVTYYVLLGISVVIAGFGLVANSPAVVIGAMLVSPLMTPIFGISLGLVRGDMALLRHGLISEFGGVLLAVVLAAMLGALPFSFEVTPEMLSRTSPTLLDLLVAAFAGLAGCLAMIDERISPVLPGIAMATALTPPLATCGLCIAFGAYQGAWGSFLLFFANFLAILAVSSIIFVWAGFVTLEEVGPKWSVVRRFAAAGIGLVVVTALLTHALVGIIRDRKTTKAIDHVLQQELAMLPATSLDEVLFKRKGDAIDILARIRTPRVLSPDKVAAMQKIIGERLGLDARLILRCGLSKDVASTGSTTAAPHVSLDGELVSQDLSSEVMAIQYAEQILRELLVKYPGYYMDSVDLFRLDSGPLILATMRGSRPILPSQVKVFERELQKRLHNPDIHLLVRTHDIKDVSSKGRVLYGQAHFGSMSKADKAMQTRLEESARKLIQDKGPFFCISTDALKSGKKWKVRSEVVGPNIPSIPAIQSVERKLRDMAGTGVELAVWAKNEVVITGGRYLSVERYIETRSDPQREAIDEEAESARIQMQEVEKAKDRETASEAREKKEEKEGKKEGKALLK